MVFIGVALLVAAGLALIISADAGSFIGLTQEQTAQVIPLVLILILVAGGVFGRRMRLSQIAINMGMWVAIFAVVIIGSSYRDVFTRIAGRVYGEVAPGAAMVSQDGASATFRRGLGGAFRLNVDINGRRTPMIFDTGATAVVLTHEDADAAGIDTQTLRYNVQVQTANGLGRAASVSLDSVRVGEIERSGIRAFVAERGALETSLLGLTFLETLSGYSVSQDAVEFRD